MKVKFIHILFVNWLVRMSMCVCVCDKQAARRNSRIICACIRDLESSISKPSRASGTVSVTLDFDLSEALSIGVAVVMISKSCLIAIRARTGGLFALD